MVINKLKKTEKDELESKSLGCSLSRHLLLEYFNSQRSVRFTIAPACSIIAAFELIKTRVIVPVLQEKVVVL